MNIKAPFTLLVAGAGGETKKPPNVKEAGFADSLRWHYPDQVLRVLSQAARNIRRPPLIIFTIIVDKAESERKGNFKNMVNLTLLLIFPEGIGNRNYFTRTIDRVFAGWHAFHDEVGVSMF